MRWITLADIVSESQMFLVLPDWQPPVSPVHNWCLQPTRVIPPNLGQMYYRVRREHLDLLTYTLSCYSCKNNLYLYVLFLNLFQPPL